MFLIQIVARVLLYMAAATLGAQIIIWLIVEVIYPFVMFPIEQLRQFLLSTGEDARSLMVKLMAVVLFIMLCFSHLRKKPSKKK